MEVNAVGDGGAVPDQKKEEKVEEKIDEETDDDMPLDIFDEEWGSKLTELLLSCVYCRIF